MSEIETNASWRQKSIGLDSLRVSHSQLKPVESANSASVVDIRKPLRVIAWHEEPVKLKQRSRGRLPSIACITFYTSFTSLAIPQMFTP